MGDITILYITANRVPKGWQTYQLSMLRVAIDDAPVVSVSREPMDLGTNLIDEEPICLSNIYRQMLRAGKVARTPFVAMVEDDTLYEKEHFWLYRPPHDAFGYNMSRFGVFTWDKKPIYWWKNRVSNSTLIAPRELLVEALEERFAKFPEGTPDKITGELGRDMVEQNLGVTRRKLEQFYTTIPVVRLDHAYGSDTLARSRRKGRGVMQAWDLYYWGRADEIVKRFR